MYIKYDGMKSDAERINVAQALHELENAEKIRTNPYNPRVIQVVKDEGFCILYFERMTDAVYHRILSRAAKLGIAHEHGRYW